MSGTEITIRVVWANHKACQSQKKNLTRLVKIANKAESRIGEVTIILLINIFCLLFVLYEFNFLFVCLFVCFCLVIELR